MGDRVLLKRIRKDNKLSTEFSNEEFVVLKRTGSDATVKSTVSGKEFRRNTSHLKRIPKVDERTDNDNALNEVPNANTTGEASTSDTGISLDTPELDTERKRRRQEPSWFQSYVPY